MPKKSIKENKSIYHKIREDLGLSREKAGDMMPGFSADRLQRIENGRMQVQPQDVVAMADCYHAPELCNHYCAHECQIGARNGVKDIEKKQLVQIAVETLNALNHLNKQKDRLLEIVEDGKVNTDELQDFEQIRIMLGKMKESIDALQLWVEEAHVNKQ